MKLKEILTKISPLPWKSYGNEILNGPRENRTYQIHAGNTLPSLAESARRMVNALEHPNPGSGNSILTAISDFKAALEKAENVKMPNEKS
jgi:hypothetical protein